MLKFRKKLAPSASVQPPGNHPSDSRKPGIAHVAGQESGEELNFREEGIVVMTYDSLFLADIRLNLLRCEL